MAPASPTAVLAVPDRPLAERPDTKGAEAPEGQFAGLLAQVKPAPRPEPRRPLPERPSKDEASPTDSALAAASAAQAQAASAAQERAATPQTREPKAEAPTAEPTPAAASTAEAAQASSQVAAKASPPGSAETSAPAQSAIPAGVPLPAQATPSSTEPSMTLAAKEQVGKADSVAAATGAVQTTVIQSETGLTPAEADAAPLAAPGLVQAVLAEADAKINPFKASLAEGRVARVASEATPAPKPAPKEAGPATTPGAPPIQAQATTDTPPTPSAGPHAEAPAVDLGPLLERASAPGAAPSTALAEGVPFGVEGAAPKLQPALGTPGVHQPEAGSSLVAMAARATPAAPAPATATAPPPSPAGPPPNAPMAQVEGSLRWMLKGGAQEAKLQLHPESLGQVTIHLKVEGGEVHARLWITEPASVQAVQEGRPHLEQSLREQGLQLGSFDLQQGHRPFQEAPGAPAFRESAAGALPIARQEAPAPAVPSILTPHHVELYV